MVKILLKFDLEQVKARQKAT